MKRIAFLSFDWDYKIVSEYYLGLQEYLRDRTDVQVFIFNAFGHYYASHMPKPSTFEIFSLYDPADYDGLIIQGNRSWPPELRQQLVDKTVELNKPVVSINYELPGAHSVGTNNYQEEYDLVYRVLHERGCQHPAFVNGLKTSNEANARAQGYRDACAKFGINDARFFQANWQMSAGVITAKKMLRKRNDLPDVVFCCNDDLAVGILQTFQDAGIRVPEDVLITGFDNRVIGQNTSPRITTIDRDYRAIAVTALRTIIQLLDGASMPQQVFSPARHVLAESCGYTAQPEAERLDALMATASSMERFYEVLSEFQAAVMEAESWFSLLENCELLARDLDCSNTFLTLSDGYVSSRTPEAVSTYAATSYLVARNGRDYAMSCSSEHVYAAFETRRILPESIDLDGTLYMASPLHHGGTCMGMLVTEGVPAAVSLGFTSFFLTALAISLETLRRGELLKE